MSVRQPGRGDWLVIAGILLLFVLVPAVVIGVWWIVGSAIGR